MKGAMPDFELQNEIYLVDGKPCKLYLPAMVVGDYKLFWIVRLEDGKVYPVEEHRLVLTKRGKLLYGDK